MGAFAHLEGVAQLRYNFPSFSHNDNKLFGRLDRFVDQPVEHVLDRPGELTHDVRANNPAAAFQRVECSAKISERFGVLQVLTQLGCPGVNGFENFTHFFDENLNNLFIAFEAVSQGFMSCRYRN